MSNEPRTKTELIDRQARARAEWDALLAAVPTERRITPGVSGDLSVKDIVAHLAAWERDAAERLRARTRGLGAEPNSEGMTWSEYENAFNARVLARWRDVEWYEVMAEAKGAYASFIAAAEETPEEVLFAAERPAWQTVAFNGYLHYLDFTDAIGAWLDRSVPSRAMPQTSKLVRWGEFASNAQELADAGRTLLYQHGVGLGYLATVAKDGGPRLHPICPVIVGDGLYAFIVPSPKRDDLLRDGRYALHSYPPKDVDDEFYVTGQVRSVEDPAVRAAAITAYHVPVADDQTLFEFLIERALLARYQYRGQWPPTYVRWRARHR